MSEEIFKEQKVFTQPDVENKQLRKEENKKLRKEESEKLRNENENEQLRKNNIVKDAEIKESIKKPKEIKSLEEDKNATDYYPNCFDKNKFKNILAIIDSNKFSYKRIKWVNSSILVLKTWLRKLEIIQLGKYLLKQV